MPIERLFAFKFLEEQDREELSEKEKSKWEK